MFSKREMMRKLSVNILFALAFISCNSQVDDVNRSEDSSMFKVTDVEVVSVDSVSSNSYWPDLKDKVVVGLKSCPTDTVHNQEIIGEDLIVKTSTESLSKTTNARGCISWKEEFNFNYLADETHIKIEGQILGEDNYRGTQSYAIAVNPWTLKTVDLKQGYVVRVQAANASEVIKSSLNDKLNVDSAHVTVVGKVFNQNSTELKLVVSTQPKLLRRNYNGKIQKEVLTGGSFSSKYFLLERNLKTGERKVLATTTHDSQIGEDGFIKDNIEFVTTSGVNANAIIEVGMEISADNSPLNLGKDEGIITIKSLNDKFASELINLPKGSIQSFNTKSNNFLSSDSSDEFGFIIDKITFSRGSQVLENMGSNGRDRGVVANVNVCLVDALIKSSIKNYKFDVKVVNIKTDETIWSDNKETYIGNGCLTIDPVISFKRNQSSSWDEFKIIVSSSDGVYSDVVKDRIVYINPKISNADFGMDSKFKKPRLVKMAKPSIYIEKFNYSFLQNKTDTFKLNRDLEMMFKRTYNVNFNPKVKVNHNYDGDRDFEGLLNGQYKLSFLVYVPKYKEEINFENIELTKFHLLSGATKEVSVENGKVSTSVDLPFNFKELLLLSNRNIAVVKLSPIDSDELESGAVMTSFMGLNEPTTAQSLLDTGKTLSVVNKAVITSGVAKLQTIDKKLAKDSSLGDSFETYLTELESQKSMVPVLNFHWQRTPKNFYKLIQTPLQTGIYRSAKELAQYLKYKSRMSESEVKDIILKTNNVSAQTLAKYCDYMYFDPRREWIYQGIYEKQKQVYYKCKENPHAFISISQENHVKEIVEQPYSVKASKRKLGLSTATFTGRGKVFQKSSGSRVTNYTGTQVETHAMLEFSKIPFTYFAAGYGVASGRREDVFTQTVETDQVMELTRDVMQDGISLPYEKFNVSFRAEVKTCALITSKVYEAKKLKTHNIVQDNEYEILMAASNKRAYVCLDETREIETSDDWYFMYKDTPGLVSDLALAKNMKVNAIRGARSFNQFRINADNDNNLIALGELQDEELEGLFTQFVEQKALKLPFKTKLGVGIPGLLH